MSVQDGVSYLVKAGDLNLHVFQVEMSIDLGLCLKFNPNGIVHFSFPRWIPGSYLLRHFAKHILSIKTVIIDKQNNQHAVAHTKTDTHTFQANLSDYANGTLKIQYEVYAWDQSVRGAHLDTTHAFFNGSALFFSLEGLEHLPCYLSLVKPIEHWKIATTLELYPPLGTASFKASNYDELIDHPVEMSDFASLKFESCGIPHEIVYNPIYPFDTQRLKLDVQKICAIHLNFFGKPYPISKYLFILQIVGAGYGGLEHRASTTLMVSKELLPASFPLVPDNNYKQLLGLFSHEYFHAWNVKRLKPACFIPYNLTQETTTTQLWWYEGITSYYDDLALVHAGLISNESYLENLAQSLTRLARCPGRFKQTLTESSYDAWSKFYQPDENAANAMVSYYLKGSILALCLDLTLRHTSQHSKSLDIFLQQIWRDYQQAGDNYKGSLESEFESKLVEYGGKEIATLLNIGLHQTQDLPVSQCLAPFGIQLDWMAVNKLTDLGGFEESYTPKSLKENTRVLGARLSNAGSFLIINQVYQDGAAHRAGLSAGDQLLAVRGLKISSEDDLNRLVSQINGATLVTVFRGDRLMQFEVMFQAPPLDTAVLSWQTDQNEAVMDNRRRWLNKREN